MPKSLLRIASKCSNYRSERLPLSIKTPVWLNWLPALLCVFCSLTFSERAHSQSLNTLFGDAIKAQTVVGAQILEGSCNQAEAKSINLGFTAPDRRKPVTQDTMFCIASCSKPLISCVVFRLVQTQQLNLDTPIDRWLPAFTKPHLQDATLTQPPTLKQLLAHRAGIYSQKEHPTAEQLRAIRDFRLTLSQSVNLITRQPLQSHPGTRYAYSGAGYCLIGAIAENATQQPIDEVLNAYLCKPLGMSSTTFFPHRRTGKVVATGGSSRTQAPHLLRDQLQFPLVGGSIHTTAHDLQRFARMVGKRGIFNNNVILDRATWSQYISQPYHTQRYGYGWTRTQQGDAIVLSHNGSLPPAQAALQINLRSREYKIAIWTLADPSNSKATSDLRTQIRQALNGG
ncbi:MAG: serine hydrolase domain-containing protein [Rubripirellula sp.]